MKILVVYQSKYGSTKQYARWIAETLHADIFHLNDFSPSMLGGYDTIIFGSYLHVGKIVDASFIENNWEILKHKKIILFSVSGAKPGSSELTPYYETSIPSFIRNKIQYFQFWGRVKRLDFMDTLLMAFPLTSLKVKALLSGKEEDKEKLRMFLLPFSHDLVKKESINPLITYVKKNS